MEKYRPTPTIERPKNEGQNSEQGLRFNPNSFPPPKNLDTQIHLVKNPFPNPEVESIRVEIGSTQYIGDSKVEVSYEEEPFAPTNETDEHEADHIIAGVEDGAHLIKASSRPGPGYLGITMFDRYTAAGAAAAHANGRDGTSHDVRVIRNNGDSVTAAGIRGLNNLRRRPRHRQRVAQELHKHDIDQHDVDRIYTELEEGIPVIVDFKKPDGSTEKIKTKTNESFVDIQQNRTQKKELTPAA